MTVKEVHEQNARLRDLLHDAIDLIKRPHKWNDEANGWLQRAETELLRSQESTEITKCPRCGCAIRHDI